LENKFVGMVSQEQYMCIYSFFFMEFMVVRH